MTMTEQELLEQAREMRKLILSRREAKKAQTVRSAQVFTQGNFTTVLLNGKYAGMSKRNPSDAESDVGIQLATRRALDRLLA